MQLEDLKRWWPARVQKFDPESVTRISDRESDPRDVGMTKKDVDAIWNATVRLYKTGLHPAIGLCIRRRGKIILDRTIGHAKGNAPEDGPEVERVQATPETLFNFFSGSKSVTAMLVHMLHERGQLHVDEPVATFIPEFAKNRKHRITIKDVLCHRSAIPAAPRDSLDLDMLGDWDRIIELICDMVPDHKPGRHPAYHALTGGYVLAEVLRRVDGRDVQTFLREEVREPMGLVNFDYGVAEERLPEVADEAFTGPLPTWPTDVLIERALGFDMPTLCELARDDRYRTNVVPAGNIIATPEEVCRFFEMLNSGGRYGDVRIMKEGTVRQAAHPVVTGQIDRMIYLPVPYSMGFMLGSRAVGFYGFGAPHAFGHLGFSNVLGYADPERDLSVAFMNTGKPLITPELAIWLNVTRVISSRVPRDRRID